MQRATGYSMRRVYLAEAKKANRYKDTPILDFNECYVIKYLLETFSEGIAIQLEMGSGAEYNAIRTDLSEGHRILVIDEDVGTSRDERDLVTPLSPMEAFDYISTEIQATCLLFFNDPSETPKYLVRYEQLLTVDGYIAFHTKTEGALDAVVQRYLEEKGFYVPVFTSEHLMVFRKNNADNRRLCTKANTYMAEKLKTIFSRANKAPPLEPVVGLGVLTYNHEGYISDCLKGVFSQRGMFRRKIVIVDDHSTDGTSEEIDHFVAEYKKACGDVDIVVIHNEKNVGVTQAIEILFRELQDGTDFFSYIEGDDYWISPDRTQKHLDILLYQPDYACSVNALSIYVTSTQKMVHNSIYGYVPQKRNSTYDLIENYIGNAGCYFYRSELLRMYSSEQIRRMKIEWLLVLLFSMQGDCYFLSEELNVYRKHNGGTWSTISDEEKDFEKISVIEQMNLELGLLFDHEIANKMVAMMKECYIAFASRYELLIFDAFLVSASKMLLRDDQRYLIEHWDRAAMTADYGYMQVLTGGHALDAISDLRETVPHLSSKLWLMSQWFGISSKVLLTFSMEIGYSLLAVCERYQIPLICVVQDITRVELPEFRRLIGSKFLYGLVVVESAHEKLSQICGKAGLSIKTCTMRDELFGTAEGGCVIAEYIESVVSQIDYSIMGEKKFFSFDDYAKRYDLHGQYPVKQVDWLAVAQADSQLARRGKGVFYMLCKIGKRYCPPRLKQRLKKILRPVLEKRG